MAWTKASASTATATETDKRKRLRFRGVSPPQLQLPLYAAGVYYQTTNTLVPVCSWEPRRPVSGSA